MTLYHIAELILLGNDYRKVFITMGFAAPAPGRFRG